MKQELIAGIIFVVMSMCLILLPSSMLWTITERWKNQNGGDLSRGYTVVMRILGVVFALAGGYLIKLAVK